MTGLEVSRAVRRSPVDCVKRYAFLYDARERYDVLKREQQAEGEEKINGTDECLDEFRLDSGDEYLDEQSLSNFATPVASPKRQPLDTFGAFVRSRPTSPGSPPPFAVARPAARQPGATGLGGSPFRWESLVNDPKYIAPVLDSPRSWCHRQSVQGRFGEGGDESKELFLVSSPRLSPQGSISLSGSEGRLGEMEADPSYSASFLTHAFKGLKLGAMSSPLGSPLISSPRLSRKISNSEYPFFKEEDISTRQFVASSSFRGIGGVEARNAPTSFLNDAYGVHDTPAVDRQRQRNEHLMHVSVLSSFHSDNPFSDSITQSALEDAFLDMAGSRLDASNLLIGSRMPTSPETRSQQQQ